MHREYHRWFTGRLGRDMGVAVFGHWGTPVLAFPTSGGDEWELEGQGMIGALAEYLDGGRIKLFCVGSNGDQSFYNRHTHPFHRSWMQRQWDEYIRWEVIPFIHGHCQGLPAIATMGEWGNLLLDMALIRMGPACAPALGALLAAPGARSQATIKGLLQVTSRIGVAADPGAIRSLAAHEDLEIRVEAVRVVGALEPDPRSGDVCLAAMDDAEWPVRAIAAASLGRLQDERALPRLARAMGDPAYWVRHHVAEAMASMGEPGAEALRRALRDANPFVRDMAAQVLFMRALADGEAA